MSDAFTWVTPVCCHHGLEYRSPSTGLWICYSDNHGLQRRNMPLEISGPGLTRCDQPSFSMMNAEQGFPKHSLSKWIYWSWRVKIYDAMIKLVFRTSCYDSAEVCDPRKLVSLRTRNKSERHLRVDTQLNTITRAVEYQVLKHPKFDDG